MKIRLLLLLALCLLPLSPAMGSELTVRFLDIGRNDGILLSCDGQHAFIDGGTQNYSPIAVQALQALGVERLTYYIGTHAHKDHVGGASLLLSAFSVDALIQPHERVAGMILKQAKTEPARAAAQAVPVNTVTPGDAFPLGAAIIEVLGPLVLYDNAGHLENENENSLILRVSLGARRFLLTADAPNEALLAIEAASPGALACDVFKNPHHNGTTDPEVLRAAGARYVVFSTEDAALPSRTALGMVSAEGALSAITAGKQNSTLTFVTDGQSLECAPTRVPEALSLSTESIDLTVGRTTTLRATTTPKGFVGVHLTLDDPRIASVDAQGKVTALAPGETILRARTLNLEVTCPVRVGEAQK